MMTNVFKGILRNRSLTAQAAILVISAQASLFAGCDTGRRFFLREPKPAAESFTPEVPSADNSTPTATIPNDAGVVRAVGDQDSPEDQTSRKTIKNFFKSTRLPGGLSSEAQAIENNLGVERP